MLWGLPSQARYFAHNHSLSGSWSQLRGARLHWSPGPELRKYPVKFRWPTKYYVGLGQPLFALSYVLLLLSPNAGLTLSYMYVCTQRVWRLEHNFFFFVLRVVDLGVVWSGNFFWGFFKKDIALSQAPLPAHWSTVTRAIPKRFTVAMQCNSSCDRGLSTTTDM
jgi:hypothetical protein